jgi:hypothetical protein
VLGPERRFVDVSRNEPVGLNARLLKEFDTPGRSGGKDEFLERAHHTFGPAADPVPRGSI